MFHHFIDFLVNFCQKQFVIGIPGFLDSHPCCCGPPCCSWPPCCCLPLCCWWLPVFRISVPADVPNVLRTLAAILLLVLKSLLLLTSFRVWFPTFASVPVYLLFPSTILLLACPLLLASKLLVTSLMLLISLMVLACCFCCPCCRSCRYSCYMLFLFSGHEPTYFIENKEKTLRASYDRGTQIFDYMD